MEGLGETMENIGLAQQIQAGLPAGQQKAPKWADVAAETEAYKAKYGAMEGWDCYNDSKLCSGIMKLWGEKCGYNLAMGRRRSTVSATGPPPIPTKDGVNGNWEEFKSAAAFEVMCKYAAYGDKLAKEPITVKQFEEIRPLGRGAFGAVFLVFKKDSAAPMATKKMFKTNAKHNKMLSDLLIEREVLSKMSSPFCVNLHYAFQSDIEVSLVLTLCAGGDLAFSLQQRYLDAKGNKSKTFTPFPESVIKFYTASMALGLQAIHDAGYVYRDLKPQNVLLDAEGQVRISDMGLTALVKDKKIHNKSGTRGYWSPETIKAKKEFEYQFEPDWWSLGVTVFVLVNDKHPFKGKTDEEKDEATLSGVIEYDHGESADLQKFISDLCTIDMGTRLGSKEGVSEIKAHPYMKDFAWAQLIEGQMDAELKPNPNDINAPSKKDIEGFKPSKEVTWDPEDQDRFKEWDTFDKTIWLGYEALFRIKLKNEVGGAAGGGGGCCTIA